MPRIFISYRRADSQTITGRIYDRLEIAFGADAIFKDVDNIPPGVDFRRVIGDAIRECDVVLVIIGPEWLDIRDKQDNRRLENPDDFVRFEVETALNTDNVLTVPVLVKDTLAPDANDLLPSFRQLAFHNAVKIRNDPDFRRDCEWLIDYLGKLDDEGVPNRVQYGVGKTRTQPNTPPRAATTVSIGGRSCYVQLSLIVGALAVIMVAGFLVLNMSPGEELGSPSDSQVGMANADLTATSRAESGTTVSDTGNEPIVTDVAVTTTVDTTATQTPAVPTLVATADPESDNDADGLTLGAEEGLGTDPDQYDTDGDGLSDGAEVLIYNTDPFEPDTDDDGRTDGDEVELFLSDPTSADDFPLVAIDIGTVDESQRLVEAVFGRSAGFAFQTQERLPLSEGDVAVSVSPRYLDSFIAQRPDERGIVALGPLGVDDVRVLDPFSVEDEAFQRIAPALPGHVYVVRVVGTDDIRVVVQVNDVQDAADDALVMTYTVVAAVP